MNYIDEILGRLTTRQKVHVSQLHECDGRDTDSIAEEIVLMNYVDEILGRLTLTLNFLLKNITVPTLVLLWQSSI